MMINRALDNKTNYAILAIALLISLCVGVISAYSPIWFVYIFASLVIAYLIHNWNASMYVMMIAIIFIGVFFPVANVNFRPEHFLIPVVAISTLFAFFRSKSFNLQVNLQAVLLILFTIYAFVISYFYSPVFKVSANGVAQFTFSMTGFIVALQLYTLNKNLIYKLIMFLFVTAGLLQTLYGLISFALYTAADIYIGGIMTGQSGFTVVTIKGTLFEANIYGSYVAACALFVFSLIISGIYKNHNKLLLVIFIILCCGLFLSWTRSAWIGFLLGMLLLVLIYRKKAINFKNILITILLLSCVFIPVFNVLQDVFDDHSGSGVFLYKLNNLFETDSGTGKYRLNEYELALAHWNTNPILGKGYYSIQEFGNLKWISNSLLLVLHDTGIIGLALFLIIVISVLFKALKICFDSSSKSSKNKIFIIGLTAGLVETLFSYNFTPAHTLAFFWVYLGLMCVLIKLHKHETAQ